MARTVVGLDIGSSGVRAAELTLGRRSTVRRYAAVPLADGVIRGGLVVDSEALTAALRELWSRGKFSSRTVVLGIANSGVLVRQMDLEWMPAADFSKGLRYQVADSLPVPVDEANLDYVLLDEIEQDAESGGESRKLARIMLVAAGRDMVDTFVRAVQAAGLRPLRADLAPFALVRAAAPVPERDTGLEAIVDIGADTVVVVVHRGGRPLFVRTLAGHGGQIITRHLMERYDWTWEEAERTKIALGLPEPIRADASVAGGRTLERLMAARSEHPAQGAIAEQVGALVTELQATLDYFRTSTGGQESISRLLLAGAAAGLSGLAATVEEALGVPVEHLAVLEHVRSSRRLALTDEDVAALTLAVGLCLGGTS